MSTPPNKPLHKKLRHRVRKYHRHLTKYLYERDTIFATLWVFVFIIVLGSLPINFYFLNPLKLALKDFDFNDITYAKLSASQLSDKEHSTLDPNIVIINIGHEDREGLAYLIEKTAALEPKVMGLDVVFGGPAEEPSKDSLLRSVIQKHKNLVVAYKIDWQDKKEFVKLDFFGDVAHIKGYANMIGESDEEKRTIRDYPVYEKHKKKKYYSFGTTLVKEYNDSAYERLVDRKKKQELLNYSRHTNQYRIVSAEDLLTDRVEPSYIKNKIALLAYISFDPNDVEDKFYSPMNANFVGKSTPDMNGIVIHANFISMVLEDNYIKKLPSWVNWLVAVLICWLHMSFFVRYYLENHIWFHLVAKIAQLLSAILFAYLGMLLYDSFNIKLDMKMSLIVIVMAVDVIYFYEAFAVWMHKKFHYRTVFHQKHH